MESEQVKKDPGLILPIVWHNRMDGLSGKSQTVARHILRQFWESRGYPVKLTNGPLSAKGVGRHAKRCALKDLEHLGLIDVERHPHQAPIASIPSHWATARKVYGVPWTVIEKEYDWREEE
jgi:hypothetical protein